MAEAKIPEPPHLVTDLKTLCLGTIAVHWERFVQEARRKRQPHAGYLADLVSFEVAKRRERRIQRRIKEARLPILNTLDGFDFSAQPDLDRDVVLDLFRYEFVAHAANVVLLGGVGTGKTHLAIAPGMACCQHERRVRSPRRRS